MLLSYTRVLTWVQLYMNALKRGTEDKKARIPRFGMQRLRKKGRVSMKGQEKKTIQEKATGNGSAICLWTIRLVRNQKGRSVLLSNESSINLENTQRHSDKVQRD